MIPDLASSRIIHWIRHRFRTLSPKCALRRARACLPSVPSLPNPFSFLVSRVAPTRWVRLPEPTHTSVVPINQLSATSTVIRIDVGPAQTAPHRNLQIACWNLCRCSAFSGPISCTVSVRNKNVPQISGRTIIRGNRSLVARAVGPSPIFPETLWCPAPLRTRKHSGPVSSCPIHPFALVCTQHL